MPVSSCRLKSIAAINADGTAYINPARTVIAVRAVITAVADNGTARASTAGAVDAARADDCVSILYGGHPGTQGDESGGRGEK
jgi:hypothetical protein